MAKINWDQTNLSLMQRLLAMLGMVIVATFAAFLFALFLINHMPHMLALILLGFFISMDIIVGAWNFYWRKRETDEIA